jgi:hypothetical protein
VPRDQNPFHYGSPVEGEQFTGREREVGAVAGRVRDHISVVLLSPRRYGKTSVLRRVESELAGESAAVIHVNVLHCKDVATLAGALAAGAYRIPRGRWHRTRQAVPDFLRRLRVTPMVSFDGQGKPEFAFGPRLEEPDADRVFADVFALLAECAADSPAALVLDEFQDITTHGERFPALLKALSDEHPHVSLVVAGSKRHMMERLVVAESAPLYGMAQKISLGPIDNDEMVDFLCRRAGAAGKVMGRATAQEIVDLVGPVPNDIQHLAYGAFEVAGRSIGRTEVAAGLAQAVAHEEATYSDDYGRLAPGQRRVLSGIALGRRVDSPMSGTFVADVGLANPSSVRKAITALEQDELVVERTGGWMVADPFLAEWLRGAAEHP